MKEEGKISKQDASFSSSSGVKALEIVKIAHSGSFKERFQAAIAKNTEEPTEHTIQENSVKKIPGD